MFQFGKFVNIW